MSAEFGEYARRVVSGWPPLTSEQREKLARLLCPGGNELTKPAKPPQERRNYGLAHARGLRLKDTGRGRGRYAPASHRTGTSVVRGSSADKNAYLPHAERSG